MEDEIAAVQGYGFISSVYISFQELLHIAFRRMPTSLLGFHKSIYIYIRNVCMLSNLQTYTRPKPARIDVKFEK